MLNRLQMPAGKAIALAAMPTAVLMGMGLTPQLAQADTQAKDRFKPGPCVTQPDEPEQQDDARPKGDEAARDARQNPKREAKGDPQPDGGSDAGQQPKPSQEANAGRTHGGSPSPSGEAADRREPDPSASARAEPEADRRERVTPAAPDGPQPATSAPQDATRRPSTTPSPSASETRNPLDPLGLGDKIRDLLDGKKGEEPATPAPSTSTPRPDSGGQGADADGDTDAGTATSAPPNKSDATSGQDADEAAEADAATREKAARLKERIERAQREAAEKADREQAERAEGTDDAGTDDARSADEAKDDAGDDAQQGTDPSAKPTPPSADDPRSYPCPTRDAKALREAKLEEGIPLLPEEPWILESSLLALHGLNYEGIVKVKTWSGREKLVLKFTASSVDIRDLRQTVVGPGGTNTHVDARKGSNSTMRDGTVTMYTEELRGNLLGIIPVTFSPDAPPPLTLPELFFTKVRVTQAGQLGGTLTVPGMHLYQTGK
ncbi:hypothetical protein [Streptomyces sp. NPDC057702]|uniref:hypothetical protein n=1 Tax=unclassified Streptomyces TaxID=2593676 RepID=UPI00368BACE5